MKTKTANSSRLDILGNRDRVLAQDVLSATLKRWRTNLGYCSIFAAVPAIVFSNIPAAQSEELRNSQVSVAAEKPPLAKKQNGISSSPALLQRQSKFLLPHQKGSFAMAAPLAGVDDCPGQAIPSGTYTSAAPYVTSGDTTGANSTISSFEGYYFFDYPALGPDHVYSFTLTGFGNRPRIEVTTTSVTYKPLVYILPGDVANACPAGTGNRGSYPWAVNDSRWTQGNSTATVDISYLPKNVPLYIFVDSAQNDSAGSGAYTIRIQDVTISPAAACTSSNPIDCGQVFIRQQYWDFLDREPDNEGLQFYLDILNGCHPSDAECTRYTRGALSANFFRSPEFGSKGVYVANLFNIVFGQRPKTVAELSDPSKVERPHYTEFITDLKTLSTPNNDPGITSYLKHQLALSWLGRTEVQSILPSSLTNQQFVQKLETIAGVTLANENTLIANLNSGALTRAQVLRVIAESPEVFTKFYIQNFVTMEYIGYLRREPEDCHNSANWAGGDPNNCGYIFHNNRFHLSSNADLIENLIVRGFIESPEYRHRFGP